MMGVVLEACLNKKITLDVDTNMHLVLSNIELRQMNEGSDVDTGLMVVEDEWKTEENGEPAKDGLLEEQSTVTMTGEESVRITTPDREMRKEGSGLSELGSSSLGSFQLIQSSQSSEIDKMIPYVPPLGELKIL